MLIDEEIYFGEPDEIGHCKCCGQTIYSVEDYLFDEYNGEFYCCDGCVIQDLSLVQVDDDTCTMERECLHCGTPLSEEYESIMFYGDEHTRWCDLTCCMAYLGIEFILQ